MRGFKHPGNSPESSTNHTLLKKIEQFRKKFRCGDGITQCRVQTTRYAFLPDHDLPGCTILS